MLQEVVVGTSGLHLSWFRRWSWKPWSSNEGSPADQHTKARLCSKILKHLKLVSAATSPEEEKALLLMDLIPLLPIDEVQIVVLGTSRKLGMGEDWGMRVGANINLLGFHPHIGPSKNTGCQLLLTVIISTCC